MERQLNWFLFVLKILDFFAFNQQSSIRFDFSTVNRALNSVNLKTGSQGCCRFQPAQDVLSIIYRKRVTIVENKKVRPVERYR